MSSPAERYAASRRRSMEAKTAFGAFRKEQDVELDSFQVQACQYLEQGHGVLVAAPTGSGKTKVGEFAVHMALLQGKKVFYTTPIKALSNQKFHELRERYGASTVGLLTGDSSVNSEADVVVMTTEVLRNMLYQNSATLKELGYVVMDEVHYLADRFRGAVWEEVIIHLPESVQVVALSATVSNAEEFGDWLNAVRGETSVVVEEFRPVPLWQHMLVDYQLFDLFSNDEGPSDSMVVSPDLQRLIQLQPTGASRKSGGYRGRGRGNYRGKRRGESSEGQKGRADKLPGVSRISGTPAGSPRLNRTKMVRTLDQAGLLPCITFIFSRAGCEAAVEQCIDQGIRLTSRGEAAEITSRVEELSWEIEAEDLAVLGFESFREALIHGVAAHHAGMLPPFKELVEQLFAEGLLKVVFATETLALGINMPARTVVLEKLDKFNGESHEDITAGEYTQLTGRAGRRGIDIEGHGVVVWQPGMDPRQVAGLASKRTYPLNSSFSPSYNMALNLSAQFGKSRARAILESSFAQFQADRAVVGLAREVAEQEKALQGYRDAMACDLGDFAEYESLNRRLSSAQKEVAKSRQRQRRREMSDLMCEVEPGDILELTGAKINGPVVVIHSGVEHDPRIQVITEDAKFRSVTAMELHKVPEITSAVNLPRKPQVKDPKIRRDIASRMRAALQGRVPPRHSLPRGGFTFREDSERVETDPEDIRSQLQNHPCHGCPQREDHSRWARRWWDLSKENQKLKDKIQRRTGSIAWRFDKISDVLMDLGHIRLRDTSAAQASQRIPEQDVPTGPEGPHQELEVAPRGQRLRRIYGEKDLFTEMVIHEGIVETLNPEEIAAYSSILVYQAKREDEGANPYMPTPGLAKAVETSIGVHQRLSTLERSHQLNPTAAPEFGLVPAMYRWATGFSLSQALDETVLAAGDFVRWAKQCIDVLDQLSAVPGISGELSSRLRTAVALIARGVVAYSTVTEVDPTDGDTNFDDDEDDA